jgi:hypothetical protein
MIDRKEPYLVFYRIDGEERISSFNYFLVQIITGFSVLSIIATAWILYDARSWPLIAFTYILVIIVIGIWWAIGRANAKKRMHNT